MQGALDELPFARSYLKETWYSGSLQTLWIPNTLRIQPYKTPNNVILAGNSRDIQVTIDKQEGAVPDGADETRLLAQADVEEWFLPCTIYFELDIEGSDLQVGIGFNQAGKEAQIQYKNTGEVMADGGEMLRLEPYKSHDVVGCGLLWPWQIMIFTKNGKLLAQLSDLRSWDYVQPRIFFTTSSRKEMSLKANFGQRPFRYDIEAHCSSLTARSREIASILPPEIFEQILEYTLVSFDDDLLYTETRYHAQPRRNWLMQVCRRWRTVCSRHVFSCLWLDSREDLSHVIALPLPLTCGTLGTISQPETPWIHQLLLSPLPVSFTFNKWDCTLYTTVLWDRLPPALSTRIPALMHSAGLSRIQELRLEYWTFPSWLRFAQFLFAFPNLRHLVTDGVYLNTDEALDTLPPWLRYHRRLRRWEAQTTDSTGPENINFRYLLLFLVGRPRCPLREKDFTPYGLTLTREDLDIMLQLVKILAHLCRMSQIDYADSEDPKNPGIIITSMNNDDRELLRLEFQPHLNFHRLVSVRVAWDLQTPGSYPERLQHLLGRLSSSDVCKCSFELSKVDISHQIEDRLFESAQSLRRHVASGMARRCAEDLVDFTYDGKVLETPKDLDVTPGLRWMAEYPAKFSFPSEYGFMLPVGKKCSISWDVSNVLPDIKGIPWVKLYTHNTPRAGSPGEFVADVEYDLNMAEGRLEFTVPELSKESHFFLVGDYIYRTPSFSLRRK